MTAAVRKMDEDEEGCNQLKKHFDGLMTDSGLYISVNG